MTKLLIVENDRGVREGLVLGLSEFFSVTEAEGSQDAMQALAKDLPDVVLLDQHMEQATGTCLLEKLCRLPVRPGVVLYSANMDIGLARQALKLGAEDCASKPFSLDELRSKLDRAALHRPAQLESLPFAGRVARLLARTAGEGCSAGESLESSRQSFVHALFKEALMDTQGDWERAAERLGISLFEFKSWSENISRSA